MGGFCADVCDRRHKPGAAIDATSINLDSGTVQPFWEARPITGYESPSPIQFVLVAVIPGFFGMAAP
jgi:hypothetical protein